MFNLFLYVEKIQCWSVPSSRSLDPLTSRKAADLATFEAPEARSLRELRMELRSVVLPQVPLEGPKMDSERGQNLGKDG